MFGKAIVGVDESSGGRDAIALARQLVTPGGELTLAHGRVRLRVAAVGLARGIRGACANEGRGGRQR